MDDYTVVDNGEQAQADAAQDEAEQLDANDEAESPSVSIEELLGRETNRQDETEEAAEPPEPPDTPAAEERKYSQVDYDKTIARVRAEGRAAAEREMASERTLAAQVRALFPGKSEAEIREAMLEREAAVFAEKEGCSPVIARELLEGRMARNIGTPPAALRQAQEPTQEGQSALAAAAMDILKNYGVNMAEVLEQNQGLRAKVARGELTLHQAHAEHMRGTEAHAKPKPPPVVRGGAKRETVDVGKLSDKEMKKIYERLEEGECVSI